jgi:hypothetical protein
MSIFVDKDIYKKATLMNLMFTTTYKFNIHQYLATPTAHVCSARAVSLGEYFNGQ